MLMEVTMMSNNVLTKKDLRRCLWRWVFTRQSPFNYETQSSGGWVYSIHPALEKIYDGDAETLAEKYKDHFKFYNTHPLMGCILLGSCIAIESSRDKNSTKQAIELRTALMGPLAGIGDSVLWVLFSTITGAIAAYMAIEGSVMGLVIAESAQLAFFFIFNKLFYVSYEKGTTFITSNSTKMGNIAKAASVVGLSVVGALIASNVNVNFGITMSYGEVTQSLNELLEMVIPNLANIITVALIYWGLGRKGMNSGKMVIIVMVIGILLSTLGILA